MQENFFCLAFRFKAFCSWFSVAMWGFWCAGIAWAEETSQAFDSDQYRIDGSLDTPMNTIAGITEWAQDINHVYAITTIITVLIFFAVSIPLVYTLYKFRAKPGDDTPPEQFHGNATLEFLWTVIPVVLLIFIAVPTWRVIFKHAEPAPNAMRIEVIGHQWWWEFRYPALGLVTANELHLPENTPIHFVLSSVDVIHSFWVPQFGGKMDVFPGHQNFLAVTTPGIKKPLNPEGDYYQGQCVELCGASHALMRFFAVIHTKDQFDRWVSAHNAPPKMETASEREGEQLFARCAVCHTIAGTASAQIPGDKIGPNLSSFGSRRYLGAGTRRNTRENLAQWINNPASIKPGALMPPQGLSEEELAKVSAYLRFSTAKTY